MTEQEALQILEKLREAEAQQQRAAARLEVAQDELKRLGFDSVLDAQAHISKVRKKKQAVSSKLNDALSKFMKMYGELLE